MNTTVVKVLPYKCLSKYHNLLLSLWLDFAHQQDCFSSAVCLKCEDVALITSICKT